MGERERRGGVQEEKQELYRCGQPHHAMEAKIGHMTSWKIFEKKFRGACPKLVWRSIRGDPSARVNGKWLGKIDQNHMPVSVNIIARASKLQGVDSCSGGCAILASMASKGPAGATVHVRKQRIAGETTSGCAKWMQIT